MWNVGDEIKNILNLGLSEETNKKMGLPSGFEMIRNEDIPQMIAWAKKEANPLYPVPKLMTKKSLRAFITESQIGVNRNDKSRNTELA